MNTLQGNNPGAGGRRRDSKDASGWMFLPAVDILGNPLPTLPSLQLLGIKRATKEGRRCLEASGIQGVVGSPNPEEGAFSGMVAVCLGR